MSGEDSPPDFIRLTCGRCGETVEASARVVMCPRCDNQLRPRADGAKPFLLDSNVYDVLVDTPELYGLVIEACENGRIELLMTHIQLNELTNHPDDAVRAAIFAIPLIVTPTYGVVMGVSKLGLARLGEPEPIEAIRSSSGNHTNDALIATIAQFEGAVLVTEDNRLTKRARAEGIEVWTAEELHVFLW